eukprot:m.27923 g.27923  ORF g.27923 m.27923 type:complete len:288 (+) comp15835_c0_seq1:328-1191(+)
MLSARWPTSALGSPSPPPSSASSPDSSAKSVSRLGNTTSPLSPVTPVRKAPSIMIGGNSNLQTDQPGAQPSEMYFPLGLSFKLVVLGMQNGGKSCLVSRYINNDFREDYKATVGIDFSSRTVFLEKNRTARLQIWDTTGCERFSTLIPSYIRSAAGAMIVYDLTDRTSFEATREWARLAKTEGDPDLVTLVVATKLDIAGEERQVSTEEGQELAEDINAMFIEASAKSGHNVKEAFKMLAEALPGMSEIPPTPPKLEDLALGHREKQTQNVAVVGSGFCEIFSNMFS